MGPEYRFSGEPRPAADEALLKDLRAANPGLRLYSVFDAAFAPYGRVLSLPGEAELAAAVEALPIPEGGNRYVASEPALEALEAVRAAGRSVYGGMEIQAGYCNGRGYALNAEEYHKCSELNYSTTGLVLLLALPGDLRERRLEAADVVGFYLPPRTAVELHPLVLHFAPCRVREAGFNCLVILTRGTNEALPAVDPTAEGEEALLWMRNKWLLCHPDSPQAAKGAFVGIGGENLRLALPV